MRSSTEDTTRRYGLPDYLRGTAADLAPMETEDTKWLRRIFWAIVISQGAILAIDGVILYVAGQYVG